MAPSQFITPAQRRTARKTIVINDLSICFFCKSTGLSEDDIYCPNCGFPQKGTKKAMEEFLSTINNKQTLIDNHEKSIKKAQNILYGLAAFFAFYVIILATLTASDVNLVVANVIIACAYLGLGIWSVKNPFAAILSGFFLYVTLIVINVIVDPMSILQGLIIKILIITGFVYGYKEVKNAEALEAELITLKKAKDFNIAHELSEMPS